VRRVAGTARPDWAARVEALGFDFHTIDSAPYWDESAHYEFSLAEVEAVEDAADELHKRCLDAVEHVVRKNLFGKLAIGETGRCLVRETWERGDPTLYGRFDFAFDGNGPPKLLEYNADTPTSLFEASVIQWQWLEDRFPGADQFNSLHEGLVERWREIVGAGSGWNSLHFACVTPHAEDEGTTRYLMATALEAGVSTKLLGMQQIGWNGRVFVDHEDDVIERLFKLYPWEWLLREEFGQYLHASSLGLIEPAWKMVLSNKGLLPLLWELFPDHPNLLQAEFEPPPADIPHVKKPLLGREGANVSIVRDGAPLASADGPYGAEGFVYQVYQPLPEFAGNHAVVGAWMVGDKCRGMGLREDASPITRNTSRFVPHLFR